MSWAKKALSQLESALMAVATKTSPGKFSHLPVKPGKGSKRRGEKGAERGKEGKGEEGEGKGREEGRKNSRRDSTSPKQLSGAQEHAGSSEGKARRAPSVMGSPTQPTPSLAGKEHISNGGRD